MWTNELLCYQKFNDYWAELTTTIMLFILSREDILRKGLPTIIRLREIARTPILAGALMGGAL